MVQEITISFTILLILQICNFSRNSFRMNEIQQTHSINQIYQIYEQTNNFQKELKKNKACLEMFSSNCNFYELPTKLKLLFFVVNSGDKDRVFAKQLFRIPRNGKMLYFMSKTSHNTEFRNQNIT